MIAKCILALCYVDAFSFGGRVEQWAKTKDRVKNVIKGLEKSRQMGLSKILVGPSIEKAIM